MSLSLAVMRPIVREHLTDTVAPYRFSDTEIDQALTDGCYQLGHDRSDLLLTGTTLGDPGTPSTYDDGYQEAVISYGCHRLFMKDSEDTHNAQMSRYHLDAYQNSVRL